MKMIKAFIRPERAEEVLDVLMEKGFAAVTNDLILRQTGNLCKDIGHNIHGIAYDDI